MLATVGNYIFISCIDAVNTTVGGAVGNRTGDGRPRG